MLKSQFQIKSQIQNVQNGTLLSRLLLRELWIFSHSFDIWVLTFGIYNQPLKQSEKISPRQLENSRAKRVAFWKQEIQNGVRVLITSNRGKKP
jgi:hypothetical protein